MSENVFNGSFLAFSGMICESISLIAVSLENNIEFLKLILQDGSIVILPTPSILILEFSIELVQVMVPNSG